MRSKRHDVVVGHGMRIAFVIFSIFIAGLMYVLATSKGDQMKSLISKQERELENLESERKRESAQWESLQTTRDLEVALSRSGLSMKYRRAEQVIEMNEEGQPRPSRAVDLARARANERMSRLCRAEAVATRTPYVTRSRQ